ncbi:hypothetical protein NJB85_13285 [Myroides odoratimimus]|uniref:hypothetical protein n=1 Tax=Myroides odoratimimus TaxID=76832 RepID=UPI0020968149|nr:hypothetical protein [Myroides odoratimimus]MCO7724154.1 hypothetical protein [Myroides odoratimimus]
MNKLTLLIATLFCTISYSQKISDTPLSEITATYLEVTVSGTPLSSKHYANIDYGQKANNKQLKNDDGTPMIFNSVIDVMNYLDSKEYELIHINSNVVDGFTRTNYFFRKKKSTACTCTSSTPMMPTLG